MEIRMWLFGKKHSEVNGGASVAAVFQRISFSEKVNQ